MEHNPANALRHPWELVRFEFIWDLVNRNKNSSGELLLLDIGCGDCFFALSLLEKKIPATIIGIDPAYTADTLQQKRKEISHPRFHLFASLEDARHLLTRPVNLVLLLDVIEHIPDDISFLTELAAQPCIDDQTRFIITVPAYQGLYTSHDEFLHHYRRYTNQSLKKNLRSSGLEPLETGYFFSSLLPVRVIQKIKEKLFGKPRTNHGLGGWTHGKFITGVVKGVLKIDIAVTRFKKNIGINLPGLSNYCVCKKPVS